ncbi:septum site-determining protein MinC [Marinobacterium sp. YM272]|uniref:septum site-determining protein MinC n=1 Tax=Marinobacterium sp. YM272 TaxID=3421654 RepID=UPI003D7F7128
MNSDTRTSDTPLFQFKNSRVSLNELVLLDYDESRLKADLASHAARLPSLFRQMPVVLNFERLPADKPLPPLDELLAVCRESELNPIGIRGSSRYDEALCLSLGLSCFGGAARAERVVEEPVEEKKAEPAADPNDTAEEVGSKTRILTAPVRSGQQVYVQGGDLIVLSSVGAGAEVMADGNIHIYGPLRGRAMAGVSGDTGARIFCQSLEAELISIAGYFKACEDLQSEHWKKPVQAHLSGTRLDTVLL